MVNMLEIGYLPHVVDLIVNVYRKQQARFKTPGLVPCKNMLDKVVFFHTIYSMYYPQ